MPITLLDIILIGVMLISALLAMIRGFMREVLSIAAWAIAAVVTLYSYTKLLPFAKTYFNNDIVAAAVVVGGTFLGTLLFLKRLVERRKEGKFALRSPSPQCYRLLQQMGLDRIFPIVNMEDSGAGTWAELPSKPEDVAAFKRNVVQAHQELGRLEGSAGETFRELASGLAGELESEERERQHGKN